MERRLSLTATLTTAGTVTPPIGPVPPDTAAALESAIDAHKHDIIDHAALHRAITAHVEAEVSRRLAARKYPDGWGLIARPTPDEARPVGKVADHLRQLATEVEPPRMADGFEADRMRLLAHRLRDVAAMLPRPTAGEVARLSDEHNIARTALLRALGVEA